MKILEETKRLDKAEHLPQSVCASIANELRRGEKLLYGSFQKTHVLDAGKHLRKNNGTAAVARMQPLLEPEYRRYKGKHHYSRL